MSPKEPFPTRASRTQHPLTTHLLNLMTLKSSNLCLSADVTTTSALLTLASKLGPSIVILKTHYDLIKNWDYSPYSGTGVQLTKLARKHGFLIFEDRKFGDIGHTVQMQYVAGSARIIEWANIVNVNMVPGKMIVQALRDAASQWRERKRCEVRTLISAGDGEGVGDAEAGKEGIEEGIMQPHGDGQNSPALEAAAGTGRKSSIVSITTLSQSFEPAGSPRLRSPCEEEDVELFKGIDEAPLERGLLILAQMSSEGNFMNKDYTNACVEAARENSDLVMGFVSQENLNAKKEDGFVSMAPGCQLPPKGEDADAKVRGDGKGQIYNTPKKIVLEKGVDVVIVGRGIYNANDPVEEAERYRKKAWEAYQERVGLGA